MKMSHKFVATTQYLLVIVSLGLLCSCTKDVSLEPQYNFGYKYNHVYKTIDEILLHKIQELKTYYFLCRMNETTKQNRDDYLSLQKEWVILPKGTLFRVERLIWIKNFEINSFLVEVKILNGYFKNVQATCFLDVDKYTDPIERNKSFEELGLTATIPDPAFVIDLGEMPEYKDEKSIPEPEPIRYDPILPSRNRNPKH